MVPKGPRAFRYRIRRFGVFVALLPAAALGIAAVALLRHNAQTGRGIAGFAAAVLAAPALLAVGVPLTNDASRRSLGIAISVVIWIVVGVVATVRATRSPVATWRDFWREYAWLAAGLWIGVGVGLMAVKLTLGSALL